MYGLLKALHLLAIIAWVGGMFFAHFCLRPALAAQAPPVRIGVMVETLRRFFAIVFAASLLAVGTGVWLMAGVASAVTNAGAALPRAWHAMAAGGIVMLAIYFYIRFVPYPNLLRSAGVSDWTRAAAALGRIRKLVAVNLTLGVLIVAVTQIGTGG